MPKIIIGLDIGGSKIAGIAYNGRILEALTIVTPKNLFEFEKNLIKLADFLSARGKPDKIGIGMAGLLDIKRGVLLNSPNLRFLNGLNLVKLFQANGFKNIKLDNDANCFTRAELMLGQGKNFNNFLAFTLGTGIGGGMVIGRKIYRGLTNRAGEFGHLVIEGEYLEQQFKPARDRHNDNALGGMLGQAFASLANALAPEAIILGGGVATDKRRHFLPVAKKQMNKFLFDKTSEPKLLVSKLKNAGALGAALLWK